MTSVHESLMQQLHLVGCVDDTLLEGVTWSHQVPITSDDTTYALKADTKLPGMLSCHGCSRIRSL